MKIRRIVLGRLLSPSLALLAQPSGQGVRVGPHQRRCGACPCRGHHTQRGLSGTLTDGLAVTDRQLGPADEHGEGPGKAHAGGGPARWAAQCEQ
jgi:hypothetical protein